MEKTWSRLDLRTGIENKNDKNKTFINTPKAIDFTAKPVTGIQMRMLVRRDQPPFGHATPTNEWIQLRLFTVRPRQSLTIRAIQFWSAAVFKAGRLLGYKYSRRFNLAVRLAVDTCCCLTGSRSRL
ncbi:hypothetical protein Trydic_g4012 [Trypoxylus dichotomus]